MLKYRSVVGQTYRLTTTAYTALAQRRAVQILFTTQQKVYSKVIHNAVQLACQKADNGKITEMCRYIKKISCHGLYKCSKNAVSDSQSLPAISALSCRTTPLALLPGDAWTSDHSELVVR